MENEMVTIQMEVPRAALDVAMGVLQGMLDAVTEAQNQVATQDRGASSTATPGSEMTPEQLALQSEIDGMSQVR